jgi:hypothetical protein
MSGAARQLRWGVTVSDPDQWSTPHREEAEESPHSSYDDWVVDKLEEVMWAAGGAFIVANPDLFRGGLA